MDIDDMSDCPICCEQYVEPKILQCNHTLCKSCMTRIMKRRKIKCPNCKAITKIKDVRPDFRLVQFLDALANQAKKLTKVRSNSPPCGINYDAQCAFCKCKTIAHKCETCDKWMCDRCTPNHAKQASSNDHSIKSMASMAKKAKIRLIDENSYLENKCDKFQNKIDHITEAFNTFREIEQNSLGSSNEIRQMCLDDLNQQFDRYNHKITTTIEENIKELKNDKDHLENELLSIEQVRSELELIMEEGGPLFAYKGEVLMRKIIETLQSIKTADAFIEYPEIDIQRNITWTAGNAAALKVTGGRLRKLKNNVEMAIDTSSKWLRINSVRLPAAPYCVRAMQQKLFCCHKKGVTVYSNALLHERTIVSRDSEWVHDVGEISHDELAIATRFGLFHLDASGIRTLHVIDNTAEFNSLQVLDHRIVYAASNESDIRVFKYDGSWTRTNTIELPCKEPVSILLQDDQIYLCTTNTKRIYILSKYGGLINSHVSNNTGCVDNFYHKYICDRDTDGKLLIVDQKTGLEVMDEAGQWETIKLQPEVAYPCGAVCLDDCIYVLSNDYDHYALYQYST